MFVKELSFVCQRVIFPISLPFKISAPIRNPIFVEKPVISG